MKHFFLNIGDKRRVVFAYTSRIRDCFAIEVEYNEYQQAKANPDKKFFFGKVVWVNINPINTLKRFVNETGLFNNPYHDMLHYGFPKFIEISKDDLENLIKFK